jgi:disulfide bond formation protein DsbB
MLVLTEVRAAMIANVVNRLRECGRNDGRVLSLRTAEWLMLIVGGLAGSLILMLR